MCQHAGNERPAACRSLPPVVRNVTLVACRLLATADAIAKKAVGMQIIAFAGAKGSPMIRLSLFKTSSSMASEGRRAASSAACESCCLTFTINIGAIEEAERNSPVGTLLSHSK